MVFRNFSTSRHHIMQTRLSVFLTGILFVLVISACKHDPFPPAGGNTTDTSKYGGFPNDIGKIFITRCATAGCHNQASYKGAGGLLLDSWEHLFDGGNNGAALVAYSPEYSSLMYFINTDPSLGPTAIPTMPNNGMALTKDEYLMVRDWVAKGCPDRNGNIPFAGNANTRQKVYMTQQGCDLVAVIDAEKQVVMRYIKVGSMPGAIESSHGVRLSHDGKYAYVCFAAGGVLQKIDTETDTVVASANVGIGGWNAFAISSDDKKIALTDLTSGKLVQINTETMQTEAPFPLKALHGIAANKAFDTLYIASQYGNVVYKFYDGDYKEISIDGKPTSFLPTGTPNPHEILMAPDDNRYFVTCQRTASEIGELRVMDAHADTLIKSIPLGYFPQEMSLSKNQPYLFVTCTEDNSLAGAAWKGSVYVININTLEIVKRIDDQFYQPHGLCVDDRNNVLYVASRNVSTNGPAPHHTSSCGGRNGYYMTFDLNTFAKLPRRFEVTPDPYSCEVRFK